MRALAIRGRSTARCLACVAVNALSGAGTLVDVHDDGVDVGVMGRVKTR